MTSIKFISFAGPSTGYHRAVNRITHEAIKTNLFTVCKGYTDLDLKNDKEFWSKHGKFLENNNRGYGYWLWKPYLIKKNMESMNENDILFYADAGCKFELSKTNKFMLEKIKTIKKEKKIIGCFTCPEISYNKMDLIKLLNMENNLKGRQHAATAIMLIKTPEIMKFVNEWWRIATLDNYHYIDDTKSISKNLHHFKDHRHDQSIYSLLTKKYNLYSKLEIREKTGNFFHTPRNRGGPEFLIKKNVTDIINIYYFKNGVIKIDKQYNSIFSDICYGKKKELVINYIDNDDRHKNVNYLEDKPVLINNVKAIEKCIYKPLNDLNYVCIVNIK